MTAAWERRDRAAALLYAVVAADDHRRFGHHLETWGVYMTDERPVPVEAQDLALRERLTGPVLDRKLAALEAMPSQIAPSLERLSPAVFREVNSSESFVAAQRS